MKNAVWWIRRDVRLHDNRALEVALETALAKEGVVVPLFVLDPLLSQGRAAGSRRLAFLLDGLRELDRSIRAHGGALVVRKGDPIEVVPAFAAEVGAAVVFVSEDHTPYSRRRDEAVGNQVSVERADGVALHHPDAVLKADGEPYVVFTPYFKKWSQSHLSRPANVGVPSGGFATAGRFPAIDIPDIGGRPPTQSIRPGETAARERLEGFARGEEPAIDAYVEWRDFPGAAGTSSLSPYLRFGMISPREAAAAALSRFEAATDDGRSGAKMWLRQLAWRDFYISILHHFPRVLEGSFRPKYDAIKWRDDKAAFTAWREGATGYPIVDAGMRELRETGWMHNRARMIAASFLVKDLLVDWRRGEAWFMEQLVDGDPAANNGGWQWVAGTGTDAAPYFRIFNPVTQSRRYDPAADYIKRWVPELAELPAKHVHQPWLAPSEVLRAAGVQLDRDYPSPIVDHAAARSRALEAYGRVKG